MFKHRRYLVSAAALAFAVLTIPITRAAELVAHYEFEDPNDLGHDSSGRGNDADTINNVEQVEGQFGQGAFFDESQSSDFIKTGGLAGFTGKPGVTLAAWVKLDDATTGFDGIISQDGGACCDNRILLHNTSHKPFINLSEHSDRHMDQGPEFLVGEWMHIAMTGQDGDGNSEARVYVNGVEIEGSPQEFPEMDDGSEWNTYLGVGESGTAHRLTGTLDDVRIYEGALTADEILGLLTPDDSNPGINLNADQALNAGTLPGLSTAQELRFKIKNTVKPDDDRGPKTLDISSFTITGGDTGNFTLVSAPTSLAPGVTEDLVLSFDNKGKFGLFSVTMNVKSNDEDADDQDVNITVRATVVNPVGPLLHLPLDETTGELATDTTGSNRNGAYVGASLGQPGLTAASGTAVGFTGGSHAKVAGSALASLPSYSVSLWANASSLGDIGTNDFRTLVGKGSDNPAFGLLEANGDLIWFREEGPAFATTGAPIVAGAANHIVMRLDGDTDIGTIFINGQAVASGSVDPIDASGDFFIGAFNGALGFDGVIDDVQVYGLAISDEQVLFLKNNPGQVLTPTGAIDTDGDGLSDDDETTLYNTDPLEADTDADGLNDGREVNDLKTNPLAADTDGDGGSDLAEVTFGLDPLDPESKLGTFLVRTVKAADGVQFTGMDVFKAALDDSAQIAEQHVGNFNFVNFRDNAQGHFANDELPFALWETYGDREDFGVYAKGTINIAEAGPRTFGVNSDDGFELQIDGEVVAEFPDPRGSSDTFGTADLTVGEHTLELWFYERGGGAQVEMFVNADLGEVTAFEDGNFTLLPAFGDAIADSDGDGLDDFFEELYFGNLAQDASGDPDGDGLNNGDEKAAGTNPTVADTDGDGLSDNAELSANPATNPLVADTDRDGLTDGEEIALGTDPTNRDTDGDQFTDGTEVSRGTDPLVANTDTLKPTTEVGAVTGAAGADFSGDFVYAINVGGGELTIGDAHFLSDTGDIPGVTWEAQNHIPAWDPRSDFGTDPADDALAELLYSIRWSDRGNDPTGVTYTLTGLSTASNYKLQLFFAEKCCDRGFDVSINGEQILDDFNPDRVQVDAGGRAGAGALITYIFPGPNDTLVINLDGVDSTFPDGNAILSGITLENIGAAGGSEQIDPSGITAVAGSTYEFADPELFNVSNLLDGLTEEGNQDAHQGTHWIALEGTFTETVTFDLGGAYNLTSMNILNTSNTGWNDSETDHFTVATSKDGGGTFSAPSEAIVLQDFSDGFQAVPLVESGVTHVQLVVTNDDLDDQGTNDVRVGLNEVQFFFAPGGGGGDPRPGLGAVATSTGPITESTLVNFGDLSGDATYEFSFKAVKEGASTAIAGNDAWGLKLDQWNEQGIFGTTQFGVADNVFAGDNVASVFDQDVHVVIVNDTTAGETRLYVDGALAGTWGGNFDLAGEARIMGAKIATAVDPMGPGSVMYGWATYNTALADADIATLVSAPFASGGGGPVEGGAPVISTVIAGLNSIGLSFTGAPGKTYDIEYSNDLQNWTVVMTGLSGNVTFEDTDAARQGLPSGYYRGVEK